MTLHLGLSYAYGSSSPTNNEQTGAGTPRYLWDWLSVKWLGQLKSPQLKVKILFGK